LDEAALKAAKECIFKPAIHDKKPVKVKFNIPYSFMLK
jgi:outer membrane biosynthesis protein TonB